MPSATLDPPVLGNQNKPLKEIAKHYAAPFGRVRDSFWPRVRKTCVEKMGLEFDRWQDGVAGMILAVDEDGDLVHTVGGCGLSICRQTGKMLATDTPILTSNNGWVANGDLVAGDVIFHPSGQPVKVLAAHPINYDRVCYEVTTTDGRSVVADAEHLWEVTDRFGTNGRRRGLTYVLTTQQMIDDGFTRTRSRLDKNGQPSIEFRFELPRQHCLEGLPEADTAIDPYLLGVWLGDGSASGAQITTGSQDVDHFIREIARSGFSPTSHRSERDDGSESWTIGVPGGFRAQLRELGVLDNKHIPESYLIGSTQQRLALLQGLLDTDAYIDPRTGVVEFISTSRDLADGVLFLTRSLGWRATLKEGVATLNGRDMGAKYRVCFCPKRIDLHMPFRLQRRIDHVGAADGGKGRFAVAIKSIEPVASRPMRCITVDSPDGLYLAGRDLIATHNTYTVASVVFGLCVEFPGLLCIWTAHHSATSDETFEAMQGFAARTQVAPFIKKIYTGSGQEEIQFWNGSRIMFGARERGFGRGIPGVDVIISDEAQILSQRAMQNLSPTMNTSELGLHIYMGTPPKPEDNSEFWMGLRRDALAAEKAGVDLEDSVWIEFGAPDGSKPTDVSVYPIMNPSFPHRTPLKSIRRMMKLLDEDGFMREAMGLYDPDEESAFDMVKWGTLANYEAPELDEVVLLLAVSPDRKWSTIGVAGEGSEGKTLVLVESVKGTNDVVPRVIELMAEKYVADVSIFGGSSAKVLKPALVEAGIEFNELTANDGAAAYGCLQEAVKHGTVEHVDQPELNFALKHTQSRFLNTGETETIDQRGQHVNVSPAVAAGGALYRLGLVDLGLPFIG